MSRPGDPIANQIGLRLGEFIAFVGHHVVVGGQDDAR
jgi:hypothetical protein